MCSEDWEQVAKWQNHAFGLQAEVADLQAEIMRHHRDFAEWEDRAETYQQRAIAAEATLRNIRNNAAIVVQARSPLVATHFVMNLAREVDTHTEMVVQ